MTNQPIVNVFEDEEHMIGALAERIVDMAAACQKRTGRFVAALSGGNTPRPLYEKLATEPFVSRMDWESCYFFLSDERCVEHASPESNYNMIRQCLLQKAPVPEENIFATRYQEEDPAKSAVDYQSTIESFFGDSGGDDPVFDLILLGMGPDGHTASLFPGTRALDEKDRLVVANFVEKFDAYRITFTLPLINRAEHVFFMVTGHAKSEIVASVLSDESTDYPAQLVGQSDYSSGGGETRDLCTITWYLDKGASSLLDLAATPT